MSHLLCRLLRLSASLPLMFVLGEAHAAAQAQTQAPKLPDYTHGARAFPTILSLYQPDPIKPPAIANSTRLHDLIHEGHLSLSLSDALALTIENNLDLAVQRYVYPIAEADVLRASSGQAARGVPGALLPSGLSAGALGVGVNQSNGTGGVGNAGGISGGGGAVQVGQVGTFDPAVSFSTSYDRTSSPLNSLVVAGVPQVTTTSSAGSVSFAQLFPDGASITMTTNGIAQNSTQQSLLFNPAVVSRMALGVNQPLLSGFGTLPNKRFLMVAANNVETSEQQFRAQVTTVVVQVENAYWDLSASRLAIAAALEAQEAAQQLVKNTQDRVEIGTAAGVDVVAAQAALASAERDLIVAQTTYQLQQAQLKSMISKQSDPELDAADVDPIDPLPDPASRPLPDLQAALRLAMEQRPELLTAQQDLRNQDITVRFTRNGMLPAVSAFALYAGSGLTGNTLNSSGGFGDSFRQDFDAAFPEYAAGLSATVSLRNRSAQADNLRARLEQQQLEVQLQRSRQQIALEVRQSVISLIQGRAQVEAAHDALRLAQRAAEAEREKLDVGVSTEYDVILRERDLLTAQEADVAAAAGYAKALVDLQRATGATLEQNGIGIVDALSGEPSGILGLPAGTLPDAPPQPGESSTAMISHSTLVRLRHLVRAVAVTWAISVSASAQDARPIDLAKIGRGTKPFPLIWQPYREQPLPKMHLDNGQRLQRHLTDGRLRLSLQEYLQLVVDNDLDLLSARYSTAIAQVDVLRAVSGQAARGTNDAPLPGSLFAGAIGAGVSTTAPLSAGGTGGAAISSQGKLFTLGPRGIFDPTFSANVSYDHVVSPLNTTKIAGAAQVTVPSTVLQTRFQQELAAGTSYAVSFNLQRQHQPRPGSCSIRR